MKKRLMFLFGFCILVGALVACGESSNNTGTTSSSTGNTPAPTAKHFKVGDQVAVGSVWKVVVNSIATNPGDDFNKPTKGQYVVVDVTLTNVSSSEQTISSLVNFQMRGTDGTQYTEAIVGNLSGVNPPPDGKVEAGQPVKGDLVYDTDAKAFTLSFTPDITSSGATVWDLSL